MSAAQDRSLSITAFLPLARMAEITEATWLAYANAQPFPHFVIDNFFDPELIDQVLAEFPQPRQWTLFKTRPGDLVRPSFNQRIRRVALDFLPPIVSRQLQKLR